MKLVNAEYGINIDFGEGIPNVIVIENPQTMAKLVDELRHQSNGGEGTFVLSENGEKKIEKYMDFIFNPFNIDFATKKITNALYSQLKELSEEHAVRKSELNSYAINLLDSIVIKQGTYRIDYNLDFEWTDLFKFYGIQISDDYDSLSEKLIEYIKIITDLCNVKILCFVNLKSFLSAQELNEVYMQAAYSKVYLILIENIEYDRIKNEKLYIIDKDNCIILK